MSYEALNHSYDAYEHAIHHILQNRQYDFLQDKNNHICAIFGVDVSLGMLYCAQIAKDFPHYANAITQGDYREQMEKFVALGEQETFFSEDLQTTMTANMARYIYHALVIHVYILKKFDTTPIDVFEIGGGYGGLCYWLQVFCPTVSTYTVLDLPAPCELQQHCSAYLGVSCVSISHVEYYTKTSNPLFVISNYGYAELNTHYQTLYKETILKDADAGFMIWNNWTGIFPFTDLPLHIENERPEYCQNKFIYF